MYVPASFQQAERHLKAGHRLSPEQLALLLERNPDRVLTPIILKYLVTTLRGRPALPAGRKTGISARIDFMMDGPIRLYDSKLKQFRAEDQAERKRARDAGETLPKARYSAHERAARVVVTLMKERLGISMTVKRFLNLVSQIHNRRVPEEDRVGPGELVGEFETFRGRRG